MSILQKINSWTRETTPDFKYAAEDLQLGDWIEVSRSDLYNKSDKRALPTSMRDRVGLIDNLPDTMKYLLVRCDDIVIGDMTTTCASINKYIPIEKIYDYEDGSRCYCILLNSNDKIVTYDMVSNLKVTTILSNLTPRYRITLDGDSCLLNIFTKDTMSTSSDVLDRYNYLLYKSLDSYVITTSDDTDERLSTITGVVSVGVLNISTWEYDTVQSINVSLVAGPHIINSGMINSAIEKVLLCRAIPQIDESLLRNKINEVIKEVIR